MNLYGLKYRYLSGWRGYFSNLNHYGSKGLLEYVRQRSRIRTIPRNLINKKDLSVTRSSITHVPSYLDICKLAAENPEILSNFREYAEYQIILDHLSRKNAEICLNSIKDEPEILSNLRYVTNILPGNPLVFNFSSIGLFSPTDLRYAKIVKDLDCLFTFQLQPEICEIGIGFGGQAAQTILHLKPSKYSLVDLAEVLQLTKVVLSFLNHKTEIDFISPDEVKAIAPDLIISNYAFSELTKTSQDIYLDNIVLNSKRGYMLYNHIHENATDSYTAREISARIPGSIILEEDPLTFKGNVLLVWGLDKPLDLNRFKVKI